MGQMHCGFLGGKSATYYSIHKDINKSCSHPVEIEFKICSVSYTVWILPIDFQLGSQSAINSQ